jgi:DNA-binding IclR family transcriptional regulator
VTAPRQDGSSARKLLRLLLAFGPARPTWTVAELAAHAELPASTAYRYVAVLRDEGLVELAPGGEAAYRLGPRAAALGRAAAATDADLMAAARPHLLALRDATNETAALLRRAGDDVVVVDRAESRQPVRLPYEVGQALPAYAGAAGRVLLAAAPEAWRASYLERIADELTPGQSALVSDDSLGRLRENGWAESPEDSDEGLWACAAAVRDGLGAVVASLGVAGPLFRLDESQQRAAIAAVRQAADAVSRDLA